MSPEKPPIVRPTDEELMMLVDGELTPGRAAEVTAYLSTDARARSIVAGLRTAATLLGSDALARADRAIGPGAESIADAVMRAVDREPSAHGARERRRRVIAVAFGLAAAAGAMLWLSMEPASPGGQASSTPPRSSAVLSAEAPSPAGEAVSAEVDAIDFGARAGTIFYVPSGAATTTAVVWLTDDEAEGKPGEQP